MPDMLPGRATLTTVSIAQSPAGLVLTIDGGTLAGANLFHSFADFNLAASDTAKWVHAASDPTLITNVINRVTGGNISQLYGTLDLTALPNTSFYFINPSGIVFGSSASVSVPNSAYFSTAGALRFANSASYSAVSPSGSLLTIAPPSGFGFLGGQGDISVAGNGSNLFQGGGSLSFSSSNLNISNARIEAGGLDLFAVGDRATFLPIAGDIISTLSGNLSVNAGTRLNVSPGSVENHGIRLVGGSIDIDGASILSVNQSSSANPFILSGNQVTIQNASYLYTRAMGSESGADIIINGGSIMLDASVVGTSSISDGNSTAGNAGSISISVSQPLGVSSLTGLHLLNGASIASTSQTAASAGTIVIMVTEPSTYKSPALVIDGAGSQITTANTGTGDAGAINIATTGLRISSGGRISTDATHGAAGDVSLRFLDGGLLTLSAPGLTSSVGVVATRSGLNTGGDIIISGATAVIMNGGLIQALTLGDVADVHISSPIIESSDRENTIAVAGEEGLSSAAEDVSRAMTLDDDAFIDVSKVLRGQCGSLAAQGETSLFLDALKGPYAARPALPGPYAVPSLATRRRSGCGAVRHVR